MLFGWSKSKVDQSYRGQYHKHYDDRPQRSYDGLRVGILLALAVGAKYFDWVFVVDVYVVRPV